MYIKFRISFSKVSKVEPNVGSVRPLPSLRIPRYCPPNQRVGWSIQLAASILALHFKPRALLGLVLMVWKRCPPSAGMNTVAASI